MQVTECILHYNKRCHNNAEKDRIGQHGENSLRKFSFCSYKEYYILTNKRKNKSEKETKLKEKLKAEEEKLPKVKEFTEKIAQIKALLPDYDELLQKQNTFSKNK